MKTHLVMAANELIENAVRIIEIDGIEIGVIRRQGRLYAYRNVCPHQGGPVCEGMRIPKVEMVLDEDRSFRRHDFNLQEMHIVCPWHGWEFKLDTGEAAGDPSIRLRSYPVQERDGNIYVEA